MPVHSAIVMWFGYADAVPAQLFFVHCLTECRKRINQIVAAFPNCRVIPCRVRLPVHQCGVVLRRTGDGIEHGAVATHFSYQFQALDTSHHLITTVRRIAGTCKHHILHAERVAIFVNQIMVAEKIHRLTALFPLLQQDVMADIR